MDIVILKNDLINNEAHYERLVGRKSILNTELMNLNAEIFRMEGVLTYIKAVITIEETKIVEAKKKIVPKSKTPTKKKA